MSLTTPVVKDYDSIFPGENWFYYWKTSASLWKSKIEQFTQAREIIIPINWAFHSETGDQYDFGQKRPETNLVRLIQVCEQLGKKVYLVISLGPAPYSMNGGIPHLLAKAYSTTLGQTLYGIIDADEFIIKLFTFFEPKVYKAFKQFIKSLRDLMLEKNLNVPLFGLDSFYIQNNEFYSYYVDRSQVYESAFSRFLKARSDQVGDMSILGPNEENLLHWEFLNSIRGLYRDACQEIFEDIWDGMIEAFFLGGSPEDFPNRLTRNGSVYTYAKQITHSICHGKLPLSILLPQSTKEGILNRILQDNVTSCVQRELLDFSHDDEDTNFKPLRLFYFIRNEVEDGPIHQWKTSSSPLHFIEEMFPWSYRITGSTELENMKTDGAVIFFSGKSLSEKDYYRMVKLFMNGQQIVLDIHDMNESFKKKMYALILENQLEHEIIQYLTNIEVVKLGQGVLLFFDSSCVNKESQVEGYLDFWSRVIQLFALKALCFDAVQGILPVWQTRNPRVSELSFEEIRRLNLYNVSSYKRKIKLQIPKTFALTKVVDEKDVELRIVHPYIEIDFRPQGAVGLDFGLYS